MKKIIITTFLLAFIALNQIVACNVCQESQPKILKNITHGTGPEGYSDYIIIWAAVILVTITLLYSIKYLIRPNENDPNHIKNCVLNLNDGYDGR